MSDARVALLYRNLGLDATWTASSQVSSLPVRNLASANRQQPWRSTGCASEWLKAQLAQAAAVQGLAIVSGNLTPGATVRFQGSATDDWANPTVDEGLVPWQARRTGVVCAFLEAPVSLPWWRVVFEDPTNPSGYLEIGVVAFGPIFDLGDAPEPIAHRRIDPSAIGRTATGTPHRFRQPPYTEVDLPLGLLTQAQAFADLSDAFEELGQSRDGVLSVFSTAPAQDDLAKALNLYGALVNPLELAYEHIHNWRAGLVFRESL